MKLRSSLALALLASCAPSLEDRASTEIPGVGVRAKVSASGAEIGDGALRLRTAGWGRDRSQVELGAFTARAVPCSSAFWGRACAAAIERPLRGATEH